jgi:glycosyltransferase involved in cell wall biosynthesis
MPIGWGQEIPEIVNEIGKFKPNSILDIGIGFGKYGVLLRENLEISKGRYHKVDWKIQMDGVEVFEGFHNPIHEYVYNELHCVNITETIDKLPTYDVVLLINVLEHFEKETGEKMLRKIIKHAKKALIISTPLFMESQEDNNPYKKSKSRWTQLDFTDFDFDRRLIRTGKNGAQLFIIYPNLIKHKEFTLDRISVELKNTEERKLTIGYFLPHKNLTGGLKMLLEQMKYLRKNGHKIYAFYKGDHEDKALPSWSNLEVDKEINVARGQSFTTNLLDCDVGIAGWLGQMEELSEASIPIVYWEQGNEYLFGDYLNQNTRLHLQRCFQQPIAVTSVSPIISKILQTRFGRKTPVIPNGIDTDFYYPGERPNENIILLVGNPNIMFKGFDVAIQTLIRTWISGNKFKVKWVCQEKPSLEHVPFPFPVEYVVMPTQEELAECYRNSDIFLFTSWYEGFGMPPLEAMASGLPVVSTACGGIEVYAKDKINALLADSGDAEQLSNAVIYLLNDKKARDDLSKSGRETALKFSYPTIIKYLEGYLYKLVNKK